MSPRPPDRNKPAPRRSRSSGKSFADDRADDRGLRSERGLGGDQVEGRRAVRELLAVGSRRVNAVYVSSGSDPSPVLDEIAELAGPKLRVVSPEKLAAMARCERPQGVVALTTALPPADLDELLRAPDAFLVALDGVTDPGNLGAVLRSAAAFGATGVVLPRHRSAAVTPVVAKAAAGAIEHLPIASVSGMGAALERVARAGVWSVGLAADGSTDIEDVAVADGPVVLVLGSEGRGLSRLVEARCDVVARIPMSSTIESLNASVAAAVACHEIARRRRRNAR